MRLKGFQIEEQVVETTYTFAGTLSRNNADIGAAVGRELCHEKAELGALWS